MLELWGIFLCASIALLLCSCLDRPRQASSATAEALLPTPPATAPLSLPLSPPPPPPPAELLELSSYLSAHLVFGPRLTAADPLIVRSLIHEDWLLLCESPLLAPMSNASLRCAHGLAIRVKHKLISRNRNEETRVDGGST